MTDDKIQTIENAQEKSTEEILKEVIEENREGLKKLANEETAQKHREEKQDNRWESLIENLHDYLEPNYENIELDLQIYAEEQNDPNLEHNYGIEYLWTGITNH